MKDFVPLSQVEKIKLYEELLDKYVKQWKRYQKLARSYHEKSNTMKINWVDKTMQELQRAKIDLIAKNENLTHDNI